ncbi:hypothetical protein TWF281_007575 [Arthrobotrys megalospora]
MANEKKPTEEQPSSQNDQEIGFADSFSVSDYTKAKVNCLLAVLSYKLLFIYFWRLIPSGQGFWYSVNALFIFLSSAWVYIASKNPRLEDPSDVIRHLFFTLIALGVLALYVSLPPIKIPQSINR